jgi:hypothetical protein
MEGIRPFLVVDEYYETKKRATVEVVRSPISLLFPPGAVVAFVLREPARGLTGAATSHASGADLFLPLPLS